MTCNKCGENMIGDGYTVVIHCPNRDDYDEFTPDDNPQHCEGCEPE